MKLREEIEFDLEFKRPKVIILENLIVLENIESVPMLSENEITVGHGKRFISIEGKDFVIREIYEGRLAVEGKIKKVEFL